VRSVPPHRVRRVGALRHFFADVPTTGTGPFLSDHFDKDQRRGRGLSSDDSGLVG